MNRNYKNSEQVDLLVILKKNPFLAEYNLVLYRKQGDVAGRKEDSLGQCGAIVHNPFSNKTILPFLQPHIHKALESEKSIICRLHGGLLCFLIPFRRGAEWLCLVGEGVREKSINILKLEDLCRSSKTDVFEILEEIEKLPIKAYVEVEEVVAQLQKKLCEIHNEKNYSEVIDKTRNRLNGIVRGLSRIDELANAEEVLTFADEMLRLLFNFSKIAVALRDDRDGGFSVKGTCDSPADLGGLSDEQLSLLTAPGNTKKTVAIKGELKDLLPALRCESLTTFSFEAGGIVFGFVAIIDSEPDLMEESLLELLTNRITARLVQLKKDREQILVSSLSGNLMSLTNSLLFAENKEELYRSVLEIAADLVGASRGSIMLIDKNGKSMNIGFCKGMNSFLAQSITVKLGEGIAGRVASSGEPLLVGDVENDSRVRMPNRPRFKTKSLLCVPLKLKDRVIGVLNLSDKENMGIFNESDLNLLASYANLASLMIERTWALERTSLLEKLSVTDHLTGLYNHRFLRSRLEEELNRSTRNGINLSVIFADLDFFKIYNDLCGHLAGDRALKKTADILKATVRDMDIVVRYGGEEFCIVLPDTSKKEALFVAERIRLEIANEKFANEENMPCGSLTASFGIASFPEDGHTYTTLVHSADLALYRAKAEGRNRVVLGRPVLPREVA